MLIRTQIRQKQILSKRGVWIRTKPFDCYCCCVSFCRKDRSSRYISSNWGHRQFISLSSFPNATIFILFIFFGRIDTSLVIIFWYCSITAITKLFVFPPTGNFKLESNEDARNERKKILPSRQDWKSLLRHRIWQ